MKKLTPFLISIILFLFLVYILGFSKEIMESVAFSISIWKDNLFPSLFPFLILSYFFTSYGISNILSELVKPIVVNLFHLPASCGFIIVLSLFSGFPSSAKFIKDGLDKNEISLKDANHLLKFCHFSSPLFVIGTIGTALLGSAKLGFIILISHYIGSIIVALVFRNRNCQLNENKINLKSAFKKINDSINTSSGFANILKNAIKNAFDVLFLLLGIITVFLIITTILTSIISLNDLETSLFRGVLEMTQGIKFVSILNIPIVYKMLFMTFFISFGGLSIHTQVLSILSEYKISYISYLTSRLLHSFFSSCILLLIYNFI